MPNNTPSRILFLARRYPPSVGGIQTYAGHLFAHLSAVRPVHLIALGKNHIAHVFWWIPWAGLCALFYILFKRPTAVYFIDGVTASLAPFLRRFTSANFVVTIHGLELTYAHPFFSRIMRRGVNACDNVIVVSKNTSRLTTEAGIPAQKQHVIYQGIHARILPDDRHMRIKSHFEAMTGIDFQTTPVLLNYGRQVIRKGLVDFLEKGAPLLRDNIRFFIGGIGPEHEHIKKTVHRLGLQDRVFVTGLLDEETVAMLRCEAHVFLMPNIHLPEDAEGFGITPLECLYTGLPTVSFNVDALGESLNGDGAFLVPPGDYETFVERIHHILDLSPEEKKALAERARQFVRREYTWEKTAQQYLEILEGREPTQEHQTAHR